MYAGELIYDQKGYRFIIKEQQLKLMPLEGYSSLFSFMERCNKTGGHYHTSKSMECHVNYFIGKCYDNGMKIVIIPKSRHFGYSNNLSGDVSILTLPILHIVEFVGQADEITGIHLMGEELDCLYPAFPFVGHKGKPFTDDEHRSVVLKNFDDTRNDVGKVTIKDVDVSCELQIAQTTHFYSKTPVTLHSVLSLKFSETEDFDFLFNLIHSAKRLLSYLCYRNSVSFTSVRLMSTDDKGSYESAKVVSSPFLEQTENDEKAKKQFIPHFAIKDKLSHIFQDVIDGKLYMRHIPDNLATSVLNVANFIMIMTAFEGEHDRLYPNLPAPDQAKIDAQNAIKRELEDLKVASAKAKLGKSRKEIYRRLINEVSRHRPLNEQVLYSLEKHKEVLQPFINYLYGLNGITVSLSEITNRVCEQRNDFAHGNLTKLFKPNANLDIRIIKCLVYTMQLSAYGIPIGNIQGILKKLFGFNIPIGVTYV